MDNSCFSKSEVSKRCAVFLQGAAQAARDWYDTDGNWIATSMPAITRERYWLAFALYACGEATVADAVIQRGPVLSDFNGVASSFDIFHTNIAVVLLIKHRGTMSADVQRHLEKIVRDGFVLYRGNRGCDLQFYGYNDNMPAKATMGLILGGEMLGDSAAVEHGLWNLHQMRSLLYRRGINNEWNSPTYSPLTLHAMSEIAEHAQNAEARDLALKIEHRLWIDLAARFHPEIGMVAGPYSRAYRCDVTAHLSNFAALLWFVMGDRAKPSPIQLFEADPGLVYHHDGDHPFNVAQMCWFASDSYHVPETAMQLLCGKRYPFHAVATAEQGDWGPWVPSAPNRIETLIEKDFAVGSSMIPLLRGEQAAPYFVLYKRAANVRSFKDVGTVFHKFVCNDDAPGVIVTPRDDKGRAYSNSGENELNSRCMMATLQSDTSVLVVTSPLFSFGAIEESVTSQRLCRLSEMLVFPSHFGGAEEVRIGGRVLSDWSGKAEHGEWIGCRRGRLLIAFRPLVYSADLGPVSITLEKTRNHEVLRSTFYQGSERMFTEDELRRIFGGFVAEHASVDDYPSLSAFMEELATARFSDQYWMTRRVRYRRPATERRKALELELSWSPGSPVTRFSTINGLPVKLDTRVQIDGLEEDSLPFLSEEWKSVPSYFPWAELKAPFTSIVGAVGDRE